MSQATSSTLSVAITCERTGYLSDSEAKLISQIIHRQMTSEAKSPDSYSDTPGPAFSSEQLYADRAIKLWCANDQTLIWLKKTVSGLKVHPHRQLVVKGQSEIQKRVNCKFQIPNGQQNTYQSLDEFEQLLCNQNPWIDLKKCALSVQMGEYTTNCKWCTAVKMEIPEDLIPTLMKAERRLSFGLTVVYIKFESSYGTFDADVPMGWDPATETIIRRS